LLKEQFFTLNRHQLNFAAEVAPLFFVLKIPYGPAPNAKVKAWR